MYGTTAMKDFLYGIAGILFMCLLCIFFTHKYHEGIQKADEQKAQAQSEYIKGLEEDLEHERAAVKRLSDLSNQHQSEIQHEKDRFNHYSNALRAGTVRVSVPVTHCSASDTVRDPTLASQPAETRAELTPEAATSFAAIASEGNEAIIGLNTCIDSYNAVRDEFNKRKNHVQAK